MEFEPTLVKIGEPFRWREYCRWAGGTLRRLGSRPTRRCSGGGILPVDFRGNGHTPADERLPFPEPVAYSRPNPASLARAAASDRYVTCNFLRILET